ncbi:hypothetical protein [Symbiopectobacterium sp. RP]|uniref:hypothetical protein n=1 Tax=Symbiopectobacterium sp. RP TaxID=3248553 RepID=UPI003D2E352E
MWHHSIANRLKNDYSQCPDMWQKIQLIVIKIMSLCYMTAALLNKSELVTTAPHTGRLLRDANTVRHS